MTPKLKPLPRLNPKLHVPITAAQRALLARRRAIPMALPTQAEMDAFFAHSRGRPYAGDTIEATGPGEVEDEMDAGFLAAVRLEPRNIGLGTGEVPPLVADRLYDAGLVRKVER